VARPAIGRCAARAFAILYRRVSGLAAMAGAGTEERRRMTPFVPLTL
jgi:hypothetical protein